MLGLQEKEHLVSLLGNGTPLSQIARQLNRSLGTVYKYKKLHEQKEIAPIERNQISSKLVPYENIIRLSVKHDQKNVQKLFLNLKNAGYQGSYSLLNSYVREHLPANDQKGYKRSVRVETEPGEQAQVDWGSFGRIWINGREEKLYAFIYVLSYSRAMYIEFVVKQNQQVLQECHIHAFEKLGMPKTIRYDNMKTVVLGRSKLANGEEQIHWNPTFQDFACFYGFVPEACPPYWPRAKGKVEAGVKYLRHSFAENTSFKQNKKKKNKIEYKSLEEINHSAQHWLDNVANRRTHATTQEQPQTLWEKEKPLLTFPVGPAYNPLPLLTRYSTKDGLVQYKSVFYSVPMEYAQKKLLLKENTNHGVPILEIYGNNQEAVAQHVISYRRGEWVLDNRHTLSQSKNTKKKQLTNKGGNSRDMTIRDKSYYRVTSHIFNPILP